MQMAVGNKSARDTLHKFAQETPVYHATLGAGDALYTPACFIVYELISDREDVLGFRKVIISEKDIDELEGVNRQLSATTPSVSLQSVLDTLALI